MVTFALFSVPHMGTNFCIHYANLAHRAAGRTFQQVAIGPGHVAPRYPDQVGYAFEHVHPQMMYKIRHWCEAGYPCLVPLRHPLATAASWAVRGKRVVDLLDEIRRLMAVAHSYRERDNIHFLPLDAVDQREARLESFARAIELPIPCDWQKIKSLGKTAEISPNERMWVRELMVEYDWFWSQFYADAD